jgi:hypothetical protein
VLRRLRRGDRCCVAEIGGHTIGYSWTGYSRWNLDDISISLPLRSDECYGYDAYVKPEFRGHGIFYSITRHLWEENRARGLQKMYTRTRRGNVAPIAGARYFGAGERLELKATQLLSLLWLYDATLTTGPGDTIALLTAPGTQIGVGLLRWSAMGRRGHRLRLPGRMGSVPSPMVSPLDSESRTATRP